MYIYISVSLEDFSVCNCRRYEDGSCISCSLQFCRDVLSITNESPASPPIEKNVYVAQAPKIISGSDLRPLCGQSLHTSSHTYKVYTFSFV